MYFCINKEMYHLAIFMYEIEFTDEDIQPWVSVQAVCMHVLIFQWSLKSYAS